MGRMPRAVAAAALLLALAGCGGSPHRPPAPPPPGGTGIVDLRSADARSPLVVARGGTWRCATDGRIQLAISAEGEATLAIDGRLLASVAPTRSVVHRVCDRVRAAARGGSAGARVRIGGVVIRCSVPGDVLVGFDHGDLTVRSPAGRFVAGAGIRADRVGVAGYLGRGCAVAR
jgi:hypothetical protein